MGASCKIADHRHGFNLLVGAKDVATVTDRLSHQTRAATVTDKRRTKKVSDVNLSYFLCAFDSHPEHFSGASGLTVHFNLKIGK